MNVFSFTGHLGRDAEVRQAGQSTVCGFSVAVTAGYGDKAQTVWVSCNLWGKRAEGQLPQYLVKGQKVAISGELSTREHEGKTYLQVRVDQLDLIGQREGGQQQAPAQQYQQPQQAPQRPQQSPQQSDPWQGQQGGMQQQAPQQQAPAGAPSMTQQQYNQQAVDESWEDDIPFN